MAVSKLHMLLILSLFALIFTQIRADDGVAVGSDDSEVLRIELNKLTSKIESLGLCFTFALIYMISLFLVVKISRLEVEVTCLVSNILIYMI